VRNDDHRVEARNSLVVFELLATIVASVPSFVTSTSTRGLYRRSGKAEVTGELTRNPCHFGIDLPEATSAIGVERASRVCVRAGFACEQGLRASRVCGGSSGFDGTDVLSETTRQ
jgi:hypothetical protein